MKLGFFYEWPVEAAARYACRPWQVMSGDASQADYSNAAVQLAQMGDLDSSRQVSQLGQQRRPNRRALGCK